MGQVAEHLSKLGRSAEALPIIDDCLQRAAGKNVDPNLIYAVLDLRLRHSQSIQDPAGCRATAERWEQLNRADPGSLYNAACLRAVVAAVVRAADSSPEGIKEAEAEADRAIDWLRKAVAAGYKNASHMSKDSDLNALRERDDFKALLAALTDSQQQQSP